MYQKYTLQPVNLQNQYAILYSRLYALYAIKKTAKSPNILAKGNTKSTQKETTKKNSASYNLH